MMRLLSSAHPMIGAPYRVVVDLVDHIGKLASNISFQYKVFFVNLKQKRFKAALSDDFREDVVFGLKF